ncbi:hypothetical protein R6Z07_003642 [Ovis aries]
MSVRSKAAKGTEGTTDGPREDAARPRTIAEPGETTSGRRGAVSPPPDSAADLSPRRREPPCPVRSPGPRSRESGRGSRDGRGTQRGSRRRHGNSQPKRENRTMWPRTSRGARQARAGHVQAGRRGPGAPANELSEQDSRGLAKPRSLERGYRRKKTNAPDGDPRAWLPSQQRSGVEDPFSARSEVLHMDGRGEMLVDPSEQPHHSSTAAPGRLPEHCRSKLQQEQACPGLSSTGGYHRHYCRPLELSSAFAG